MIGDLALIYAKEEAIRLVDKRVNDSLGLVLFAKELSRGVRSRMINTFSKSLLVIWRWVILIQMGLCLQRAWSRRSIGSKHRKQKVKLSSY